MFVNTFKSLDDITDIGCRKLKRDQVITGVKAGYDELVKMTKYYFLPQTIMLVLLSKFEGPCFARALVHLLLEKDCVPDNWETRTPPALTTQLAKSFKKVLDIDPDEAVHWVKQHGLFKKEALEELWCLSQETPLDRTQQHTRGTLHEFGDQYPAIYTTLKSTFLLMPSSSRIAEHMHAMLRSFLTPEKINASIITTDQYMAFTMNVEYNDRKERRNSVRDRRKRTGKKPPMKVSHEMSKTEQQMESVGSGNNSSKAVMRFGTSSGTVPFT